jgi:pyruvate, water dikinase
MPNILFLDQIQDSHKNLVGDKAFSLFLLSQVNLPVPQAFVVTSQAFLQFFQKNNLQTRIKNELELYDLTAPDSKISALSRIRNLISTSPLPDHLATQVFSAYDKLVNQAKNNRLSIRMSPHYYSIPGHLDLYLNIKGENTLIQLIKEAWAKQFTFSNLETDIGKISQNSAIIVQELIDAQVSGYLHTIDNKTDSKKIITIEAIWGLGELISHKHTKPDRYRLDKDDLKIISQKTYSQEKYLSLKNDLILKKNLAFSKQLKPKLSAQQIIKLASYVRQIKKVHFYPQTVEWVLQGSDFYFLQTQHLLDAKKQNQKQDEPFQKTLSLPIILEGHGENPGIVSGKAFYLSDQYDQNIDKNEIAIIENDSSKLLDNLKNAQGIICQNLSIGNNLKLFCRQNSIPLVVGALNIKDRIQNQQLITMDGANGFIYQGLPDLQGKIIAYSRNSQIVNSLKTIKLKPIKTAIKVFVDLPLGEHKQEIDLAQIDGVAYLRGELILSQLDIHPRKLMSKNASSQIKTHLKNRLSSVLKTFSSQSVYYKLSDFNSYHAAQLQDGHKFENKEVNPIMGFRGAYRLLFFRQLLEMELEVLSSLRTKYSHLHLVLPFLRNDQELESLQKYIADFNLHRSLAHELWLNLESPANLIDIPKLIDKNISGLFLDLTSLTSFSLGVDPNNTQVKSLYNENDPAIWWLMNRLLTYTSSQHLPIIICNSQDSFSPEFLQNLIKKGIYGLSVAPDQVLDIKNQISKIEHGLVKK